jgi:maltooligosyltrehalose trehalohydrolase
MVEPYSGRAVASSAIRRPSFLDARLGATRTRNGQCEFLVWAPNVAHIDVRIVTPSERVVELTPETHGYHYGTVDNVRLNASYWYRLDGDEERADPASRFQPNGVDGPSQVVETSDFEWTDQEWRGLDMQDYIFYELHTGTYTSEGMFDATVYHLDELKALGVSAIELMPVAQFPGSRNWGYDGVFPFAVQNTYGGPKGLQGLVNACHSQGLAVVLDVVYNHLGPEGNYLAVFGPYFTQRYQTPWGTAINFDGPGSDHVVRFFIENAIYWLSDFHIDALRLDAIHGIVDRNAQPFLALLSSVVDEFGRQRRRRVHLFAESDLNDSRFVLPRKDGGYGLHGQWNDDFHHALHSLQTGEQSGYYADYGSLEHLRKALHCGFVFTGQYSAHRQRRHGNSSESIKASQLVVYSQNHDQIGNRLSGERSSSLLLLEELKLSAGMVILSPFLPLLFMGEEYGETAPFLYFTSHHDPILGDAVRQGRATEFSTFGWIGDPPDPQAESSFLRSKLDHKLRDREPHRILREFYGELIRVRKASRPLHNLDKAACEVDICESEECVFMRRNWRKEEVFVLFNFGNDAAHLSEHVPPGEWLKLLDSADTQWLGAGAAISEIRSGGDFDLSLQPKSFCVFRRI